jgi:CheY-like chemotaxis protein
MPRSRADAGPSSLPCDVVRATDPYFCGIALASLRRDGRSNADEEGAKSASVLVVDDDRAIADVLVDFLDEEGYCAHAAFDGASALQEIEHAPPDLVVSDMVMPQIDGVTLAKELRAQGLLKPMVLMSAVPRPVEFSDVAVIAKPFDLDDLLRVIRQVVAEHARLTRGERQRPPA